MEMLRSCYRSRWALHRDPAILSPGRYYFTDDDVPFAPFPTLLASRNWEEDDYPAARVRIWGEWDGKQKWDAGAKPDQVPEPRRIGSLDCLSNGASAGDVAPGNPVEGPFRTVCIGGTVYSFPGTITVSYTVAYLNRDFTYYGDKELTLVEADCEARYEGPSGIPNTTAIVRVTEAPGGLETNFYLCETIIPIPPITLPCCGSTPVSGRLRLTSLHMEQISAFYGDWTLDVENVELKYGEKPVAGWPSLSNGFGWWGLIKCDGTPGTPGDFDLAFMHRCFGVPGFESWQLWMFNSAGSLLFHDQYGSTVGFNTCAPFHRHFYGFDPLVYNTVFCGNILFYLDMDYNYLIEEL